MEMGENIYGKDHYLKQQTINNFVIMFELSLRHNPCQVVVIETM